MAKYLNIDGNYKIAVTDGGEIRLDPGSLGTVRIIGNLTVDGDQTVINSTQLSVDDPFITVNQDNNSGGQITGDVAGIQIDRGGSDAFWIFDEGIVTPSAGTGAFVGRIGNSQNGNIVGIRTTSIDTAGADLKLINQGTGLVDVTGTTDYEKQIFEYDGAVVDFAANPIIKSGSEDALVNAQGLSDFVDGFFVGKFQSKISKDDSFVAVHDLDGGDTVSAIEFTIDGNPAAFFFNDRTELQHIRIQDTKIETTSSNADLILSAQGTGSIKFEDVLHITKGPYAGDDGTAGGGFPNFGVDADIENPDPPTNGLKLYVKTEEAGGSALYFVNSDTTQDELVSRNRAILYGFIF
ncbi:hypothetical protein N9D61_03125 [Planktomarina sp.]|jgi:hypothetical protein|nr:hypothetical protein [Planktomarina sp.]